MNACKCGETPELVQVCEWPAQYRVVCKCGQSAIGFYYGSDDKSYRHAAAKKAAVKSWNSGEREQSELEERKG